MTTPDATATADVVIVGGGPTGLMLAAELRLGGADPVVLEQLPEISQIPKGNGLIGQIVPTLQYRGLADRFRAEATYTGAVPQIPFGSLRLDFSRLDTSPLDIMAIPQRKLERVLDEWLRDLGGSVRRGHEVLALSLPGDRSPVTLDVRGPDGGYQVRTRYLVGCDGARSLVRKQAGIGFPGVTSSEISRIGRVFLPTVQITPDGGHADVPGVGLVPLMMTTQTPRGQRAILQTRAQRALSAGGEYAAALRELFGELMQFSAPLRHVGTIMEGSDVRYEMPAAGARPHPQAGRFAPDLRLDTGSGVTRVAELVKPARGVLLDLSGSGEVADSFAPRGPLTGVLTANSALAGAASGWHDRVSVTAARPMAQPVPAAAMLIRPDGYVAWAAGPDTADLAGGLPEALRTWFGEPG
jgi:2-polyprenyl-6-methoxyphenol hydroxylase-like FAD-dependent oxidoreductase